MFVIRLAEVFFTNYCVVKYYELLQVSSYVCGIRMLKVTVIAMNALSSSSHSFTAYTLSSSSHSFTAYTIVVVSCQAEIISVGCQLAISHVAMKHEVLCKIEMQGNVGRT